MSGNIYRSVNNNSRICDDEIFSFENIDSIYNGSLFCVCIKMYRSSLAADF